MKAKHQRLTLALLALVALIGAGLLAAFALRDQASYFYTPSDIVAKKPEAGQAIRLGGMVEVGSIKRDADGVTVNFIVQDGDARQAVSYTGITPDLFVEGSGVVADGSLTADGQFVAETLLAKHDENYVPRELEGIDMTGTPQATGTLIE
ncbi:cytochrome c-type biogenesis protein CcmE [Parasphingorhabdus marina DSM 22363]|uniref:Cytochrome c-type biogenesis protein CcmE n=1 Tax=Parasphingorhabdus marina DSM 22363 TaxID=1123272 RepID=A0A1N6GDD7_9SPHN|nr:cytochrome c maturation protein CcmE [Parasphingorhabdus marina]SIO05511.1 cytochrome c-type biogenesis protein CcmE [Parasphingorhabdus marina DSM 22363]